MRLPRDISGSELAKRLSRLGYAVTRQTGSHLRLTTTKGGVQRGSSGYGLLVDRIFFLGNKSAVGAPLCAFASLRLCVEIFYASRLFLRSRVD